MLMLAALFFPASFSGADERDEHVPALLEWTLLPGESLPQLAALIYPHDAAMQRHFVVAVMRINAGIFENRSAAWRADQPTAILLPDLKQLSSLARKPHRRSVVRIAVSAMQPRTDGAELPRLRMSDGIVPHAAAVPAPQLQTGKTKLKLVRSLPGRIEAEVAELDALAARNAELQTLQTTLDGRLSALQQGIARLAGLLAQPDAVASPPPRHLKQVSALPEHRALPQISPDYPLSALGLALAGWLLWRRRQQAQAKGLNAALATTAVAIDTIGAPIPVTASAVKESAISVDEITSIVEEANIFVALGRGEHAMELLRQHVETYPHASVHPWLYLMDVLRAEGRKDEFVELARRFHQTFNAIAPQWDAAAPAMMVVAHSIEEFPHILARLTETWGKPECEDYLDYLLRDNRGGERIGFSKDVLEEILLLQGVLDMRRTMPGIEPELPGRF